ncbi:MAG: FkbM family methyltransferase [Actinomycetota bacterium]
MNRFSPRRLRVAIEQRRFQLRARREFEAARFTHEYLQSRPDLTEPGRLARHEHRVYSQNGEDGVISEIFRRIGTTNQYFVEFGCGNGIENNSLFLLHRDWQGLWLDGDPSLVSSITGSHGQFTSTGQLTVKQAMVTAENIESLFADADVPEEPDLISIDIDGNDYWVWQALENYRPRAFVVEYNAFWPPDTRWVQAYEPTRGWDGTTYHGASLASLVDLGEKKGYRLVHCDLAGVNAFFVRDDVAGDHFAEQTSAEAHYQPARYFLASVVARPRSFGPFESI